MPQLFSRVLAAVLAALGAVCAVTGVWFMSQLGTDGRATFSAEPGSQTLVVHPDILNRVDSDVVLEARAPGAVWMGLARPSDAESVMKDAKVARATTVSVPSWELETVATGSGETADPASYDLWQAKRSGNGSASITVTQDAAPQTLVVAAEEGQEIESVTMTVRDSGWFTRAVVLTIIGLVLLAAAAYLVLRSRSSVTDEGGAEPDETSTDEIAADETEPAQTEPTEGSTR